jgi:hypothetical protein
MLIMSLNHFLFRMVLNIKRHVLIHPSKMVLPNVKIGICLKLHVH